MLEPMLRITCGAILRAVFGAEGPVLDELRDMVPALVTLGSVLAVSPPALQRDLGPWSPYGRYLRYRRRFDAIIDSLIADARADPAIEERRFLQSFGRLFAGTPGTLMYRELQRGRLSYRMYHFTKD